MRHGNHGNKKRYGWLKKKKKRDGKVDDAFGFTSAGTARAEFKRSAFPKEVRLGLMALASTIQHKNETAATQINRSLPEKLKVQLGAPRNVTKRLPGLHRGVYEYTSSALEIQCPHVR